MRTKRGLRSIVFMLVALMLVTSSVLAAPQLPTGESLEPPISGPSLPGRTAPPVAGEEAASLSAGGLGDPGLSFRYLQNFGTVLEPYLEDYDHLNRPSGIYIDPATDDVFVTENQGSRLLKYSGVDGSFDFSIGTAGIHYTDQYSFNWPNDVVLAPDGHIWVADWCTIVEYTADGDFVQNLPEVEPWFCGQDEGRFDGAHSIAFDEQGHLFVAELENHRVQIFDWTSGNAPVFKTQIGETDVPGPDLPNLNRPSRVIARTNGDFFIVEGENGRVDECTYDSGTDSWDCSVFLDGLNNPTGISFDPSSPGDLFILDSNNGRIVKCVGAVCSDFAYDVWGSDLAVDSAGIVYVAQDYGCAVSRYEPDGDFLDVYLGDTYVCYLTDTSHFNQPRVEIDAQNNMLVLEEAGSRLLKFSPNGTFLWSKGTAGHDDWNTGNFNYPHGLDTDADLNIYVADNWRVQIFDEDGNYIDSIGGEPGTPEQIFTWATDVAVDPISGNIYVVDNPTSRVLVFNSAYTLIDQIGVTDDPGSCDVNADNDHLCGAIGVETDASGNVYVTEYGTNRVLKFNDQLDYQLTFGFTGENSDQHGYISGPDDLTVGPDGKVYVADMNNGRVEVFSAAGDYLASIGGYGGSVDHFRQLTDVSLDSQGNVYVSDFGFHRIRKYAVGTPGWEQKNLSGFGNKYAGGGVQEVFGGYLYASASNWVDGAHIWRSPDGDDWTEVTLPGEGINAATSSILDMVVFGSPARLYASTGWSGSPAQIWRSSDGETWSPVVSDGFGNDGNTSIDALIVYNNSLYASVTDEIAPGGVSIYRSSSGNVGSWQPVVTGGNGDPHNIVIDDFVIFENALYAVGKNDEEGAFVWRASANGNTWTQVNTLGFGTPVQEEAMSTAVFDGYLYVGTYSSNQQIGQIWRSDTGTDWSVVVDDGFGDPHIDSIPTLIVYQDELYATSGHTRTGSEIWKTSNGTDWQMVVDGGFGDHNNSWFQRNHAASIFQDELYFSAWNGAVGVQVWKYLATQKFYIPVAMNKYSPPPPHWVAVSSPVSSYFRDVDMLSSNDGWIVGSGGTILHWNGSTWTQVPSGTTTGLKAISMTSPTSGWAIGSNNLLLRYNGTSWTPFPLANNLDLWSIDMLSASDGFIIGQNPSTYRGQVFRWNGTDWVLQAAFPHQPLARLDALSANNVWGALGALLCSPNCDDQFGYYTRYNGSTWTGTTLSHRGIYGLDMLNASYGWMTGIRKDVASGNQYSVIMRWNGSTWTDITHPDSFLLSGVAATSTNFALAVGYGGKILGWNGTTWTQMTSPTTESLQDVFALSETDAWAVGNNGAIVHLVP